MITRVTYHGLNIADALKGEVCSSISHVYEDLLYGLVVILRVDALCGSKLLRCNNEQDTH